MFEWDIWISSATMLYYYTWSQYYWSHHDAPYDNADFGRCRRLVKRLPRIKEVFPKISESNSVWAKIIENRDMLGKLYESQKNWENDGKELYNILRSYRG